MNSHLFLEGALLQGQSYLWDTMSSKEHPSPPSQTYTTEAFLLMKQASQGLPGGSGQLEGTGPSFDLSRAELGSGGANPSSVAGRHPGRGFARRKHAERGEESPLCSLLCRSTSAAASGFGGRQACWSHT